jgi:hypothetical protein
VEQFLLQMAAVAALGVVVAVVRTRRAVHRRASLRAGEQVRLAARLAIGGDRLHRGRLSLSPVEVAWRSADDSVVVDLRGAQVLSATDAASNDRPDDVVVRLALPERTIRLQLFRDDAAALLDALAAVSPSTAPPPPVARQPRRWSRWAICCLLLAGLWFAGWAWLVAGGHTSTATVTGGDGEGLCDVVWAEPSGRASGEVDCSDEPAGTRRTIWVLGWPATGEPVDPGWTIGSVLVLGGLVAVPGAIRLLRQVHLRRRPVAAHLAPADPPPSHPQLPELEAGDLQPRPGEQPPEVVARLAPYARRQVPDDGWAAGRRPVPGPIRPLRFALALRGPAVLLVFVLASTSWWSYRWVVLETGLTGTATAVSTGEEAVDGPWPLPHDVTVAYRGSTGPQHLADVATDRALPEGARVEIEYSLASPGQARLAGDGDALGEPAGLGGAGVLLGAAWAAQRVRGEVRRTREVHRAHGVPPRAALGLLTADGTGSPLVLLCDPLVVPLRWLGVPVESPLPDCAAAAFAGTTRLVVHGVPAAGEWITVEVPNSAATLFPAGPAVAPDADDLVPLLDSAAALA